MAPAERGDGRPGNSRARRVGQGGFRRFLLARPLGSRYSPGPARGRAALRLLDGRSTEGGETVYVACSSLCFSRYPLADALYAISELRFHKVDLALHEAGPHLKPSDVLADVNKAAANLRKANVAFAAFHVEIDAPDAERHKETLRAVCRLGRILAVPLVNIPAAPADTDLAAEVIRLTGLVRLAQAEGVMLTVETHSRTLTNDPARAAELCRQVPGLGITLDPSHYLVGAHPAADYDDLFPHVRHVRPARHGPRPAAGARRPGPGGVRADRQPTLADALRAGPVGRHPRPAGARVPDGAGSPEAEVSARKHGVNVSGARSGSDGDVTPSLPLRAPGPNPSHRITSPSRAAPRLFPVAGEA